MNTESCDMRRVATMPKSSWDLKVGEFYTFTSRAGQKYLIAMFPGQNVAHLPIRPLRDPSTNGGHSWDWDGNEVKPTLTPSVHCVGKWHGYVTAGRMVSC